MRLIENIPHPHCCIQIFSWNNKYILKLEWGNYEQIYKIEQTVPGALEKLKSKINVNFLESVRSRFLQMHQDTADFYQ